MLAQHSPVLNDTLFARRVVLFDEEERWALLGDAYCFRCVAVGRIRLAHSDGSNYIQNQRMDIVSASADG